jgi:diamine N-acetyltransferase
MSYKVREAIGKDFVRLQPLHKEVHDLHVSKRPDKYRNATQTLDKSYYEELLTSAEGKVYVIEDKNQIVAFTILKKMMPPDWNTKVQASYVFMEDLGVTSAYRGEGLARLLFNEAIEFTRVSGANSLELGVWEFNQEAIGFYEKMGMTTQARKMEFKV